MYAKDPKNTDDYIEILKGLDNREKLKIISALTDSMLKSPAVKKEALKAMERLRELYPMPTDIDYEKEREIAMGAKYDSLD
jgi:hypothetical protein